MPYSRLSNRIGTSNESLKRMVKVYDVDAKKLIYEFESVTEAAEFLGLKISQICEIIKNKRVNKKNKINKRITVR